MLVYVNEQCLLFLCVTWTNKFKLVSKRLLAAPGLLQLSQPARIHFREVYFDNRIVGVGGRANFRVRDSQSLSLCTVYSMSRSNVRFREIWTNLRASWRRYQYAGDSRDLGCLLLWKLQIRLNVHIFVSGYWQNSYCKSKFITKNLTLWQQLSYLAFCFGQNWRNGSFFCFFFLQFFSKILHWKPKITPLLNVNPLNSWSQKQCKLTILWLKVC